MMNHKRRAVAPVIATLLMVAIAVVGGMLVFVFAQDFFQSTDTMSGPQIEFLHIYGYDVRDVATGNIEDHNGDPCVTTFGAADGTLGDGDVFTLFVRNLGSQDVILSDVSVFNNKASAEGSALLVNTAIGHPIPGGWIVSTGGTCATTAGSGTAIPAGRDATILVKYSDTEFGSEVKIGRPIFVKLETGGGNVFSKQLLNGRQIG